ncbi:MAG: hypothetical protein OEM32_02150 [Acidimicrobiia bacterium]|nr:hypothetical protein [Acidimicrobiia bacterium]
MITFSPSDDERFLAVMAVALGEDESDESRRILWRFPPGSQAVQIENRLYLPALSSECLGTYSAQDEASDPHKEYRYQLTEEREAIVAVHGIGEQVELSHGTTYANALKRPLDEIYETPFEIDDASGTRTRQFTLVWRPFRIRSFEGGGALIKTDIYEHYWQPYLRGSKLGHFVGFVRSRVISDDPLPRRMRPALVPILVLLLSLIIGALLSPERGTAALALLAFASVALLATRVFLKSLVFTVALSGVLGLTLGMALALVMSKQKEGPLSEPLLVASLVATVAAFLLATSVGRANSEFPRWGPKPGTRWELWVLVTHLAGAGLLTIGFLFTDMTWPISRLSWDSVFGLRVPAAQGSAWLAAAAFALLLLLAVGIRVRRFTIGLLAGLLAIQIAVAASLLPEAAADETGSNAVLQVVVVLLGGAVMGWVINHLGDVLRYLDSNPNNHEVREKLTRSGEQLLARLHTAPKHKRVVVIAHSMGTMVAYDMMLRYWQGRSEDVAESSQDQYQDFERTVIPSLIRRALSDRDSFEPSLIPWKENRINKATDEQKRYWAGQKTIAADLREAEAGRKWLVTDFVTLSCPYNYADFTYPDLHDWILARRFATIPPISQSATAFVRYLNDDGNYRFHQSAVFGPTRWTNFYYENDIVGGPVVPVFGPGAEDVAVQDSPRLKSVFPVNHTAYPHDKRIQGALRRILDPSIEKVPDPKSEELNYLVERGRQIIAAVLGQYQAGRKTTGDFSPNARFWTAESRRLIRRVDPMLRNLGDGDAAEGEEGKLIVDPGWVALLPSNYFYDPTQVTEPRAGRGGEEEEE